MDLALMTTTAWILGGLLIVAVVLVALALLEDHEELPRRPPPLPDYKPAYDGRHHIPGPALKRSTWTGPEGSLAEVEAIAIRSRESTQRLLPPDL